MTAHELKELRNHLGLTQTELAQRLGVALRTVQSWELGERGISEPISRLVKTLSESAGA